MARGRLRRAHLCRFPSAHFRTLLRLCGDLPSCDDDVGTATSGMIAAYRASRCADGGAGWMIRRRVAIVARCAHRQ
jgi:hypothetical protein